MPAYLENNFNFLETAGQTDVSSTITRIVAQALLLGWTNPGSGRIKSPPNSVGQFIDCQFNRISATNLELVMTDSLSRSFTRRAQPAATFVERLYVNTQGFLIDYDNGEGLWASIFDLAPELQDAHDQFAVGNGARTAANTLDSIYQVAGSQQLSSASPRVYTAVQSAGLFIPRGNLLSAASPQGFQSTSQGGSRLWYPWIFVGPVTGVINRIRGRVFQALIVDGTLAAQTEIVVPINGSSTGTFKVTAMPTALSGTFNGKVAWRKA
jgi:hypothetical protein